ncbi:hypothetical protein EUX98_g8445 [Antrodiella citrinella]|uniref:Protein kinase domain-containing protein n=1 Tax=Antrodiella citrinella TaxID=2447956 RepID=A0A4S4M8X3_9APHY|nr:hypothetical protein EUX98_g8445 [Antrodiella citrinella]
MLASTPPSEYRLYRPTRRDISPYAKHVTPSRMAPSAYRAPPILTPSPLKRQAMPMDEDDVFSSPLPASFSPRPTATRPPKARSAWPDHDDDGYFLAPSSSYSQPLVPSSSPMPMRTPIKKLSRPALSNKHINSPSSAAAGTKRKPTPVTFATPSRKRTLTPLTTARELDDSESSVLGFDRLAPLAAPRFSTRTPHHKMETDILGRQADSMTRLRLQDREALRDMSGDESGYDSGPEVLELSDAGKRLAPSTVKGKGKLKPPPLQPTGLNLLLKQGKVHDDEVVEAISPGGHVTKRRARSRPVSAELRSAQSVQSTPLVDKTTKAHASPALSSASPSTVQFPTLNLMRLRRTSNSSTTSSEGSPRSRQRMSVTNLPRIRTESGSNDTQPRALSRFSSASSATFFFGPSIPQPGREGNALASSTSGNGHLGVPGSERPAMTSRHSYGGGSSLLPGTSGHDSEDEFFLSNGPPDSSFSFSVAGSTPSPQKPHREEVSPLPKKFRPRDSGIALDESDGGDFFCDDGVPRASTSVSTMGSNSDSEALVTPGFAPGENSGWPTVVNLDSDDESYGGLRSDGLSADRSVDDFIMRYLAGGGKSSVKGQGEPKRVPGTPVKRVRTAQILDRPWQSAVTHKIGFPEFNAPSVPGAPNGKGKPRKSLPAAFPMAATSKSSRPERIRRNALKVAEPPKPQVPMDVEAEEDEETSPTLRRDVRYDGLGLGRPPVPPFGPGVPGKSGRIPPWIMRRSSSGAFSSGSETCTSLSVTPTRATVTKDWNFPATTASSSSATPIDSPTASAVARHMPPPALSHHQRGHTDSAANPSPKKNMGLFAQPAPRHSLPLQSGFLRTRRSIAFGEEQAGRFESNFVEIEELGRGQFGRVMKVRYKQKPQVFAVKKSKRYEGVKHRRRLREEVDVLKHLAEAAGKHYGTHDQTLAQAHTVRVGCHPNVLGYVDSWEEDETLFIQTELCELGNFGNFLWAYGKAFPRLDEARVWKIFADLSSGLEFIHDAGVIHLDLKPANIFVTGEGRLKIGDFASTSSGFEREGDKFYLAPEVLQGKYSKAADIFSLGLIMLEAATNIVVPDQGVSWHRLRHDNFTQVDFTDLSSELVLLLKKMLQSEPAKRVTATLVAHHPVVRNARERMDQMRIQSGATFPASPLAGVPDGWLDEILCSDDEDDDSMDTSL